MSKAQTLTIENVSSVDDTSFSCQLLDENEQIITHWVSVKENEVNSQIEQRGQGMPRVIRVFPEEPKIFKKNEPFTIMCEVGGYPKPTISWSHKVNNISKLFFDTFKNCFLAMFSSSNLRLKSMIA